jgi:phosphatidylserine/phosphatidylglycerophosphate/cardiolipin synthase-like enzyme
MRGDTRVREGRTRALTAAIAALALGVSSVVLAEAARAGSTQAPSTSVLGAVWNNPVEDPWAITDRLERLIGGAPSGSMIRVAVHLLTENQAKHPRVVTALLKAYQRGVKVRVVLDRSDKSHGGEDEKEAGNPLDDQYVNGLRTALGKDVTKSSYFVICGEGLPQDEWRGCSAKSYMHNKFFLFSETLGNTRVVMQSTGNVNTSNGESLWNVAYAVAEHDDLYVAYRDYFDKTLAAQKLNSYSTVTDGNFKAYFFPRAAPAGEPASDPGTDTVVEILDNVKCGGNTSGGTSDHKTFIRIAQFAFKRVEVAKKLDALAKDGCWIEVVVNVTQIAPEVRTILDNPRINLDNGICWAPEQKRTISMHAKYMLIDGNYDGVPNSQVVWLGSANFTIGALRNNDETWMKIKSNPNPGSAFYEFREQFRKVMTMCEDMRDL